MAPALQPASHEARHGTVAETAAAAGGTPSWLDQSMDGSNCEATSVLLLQMPCVAQTHDTASAMRPRAMQLQTSCRPGYVKKLCQTRCAASLT